MLAGGRVKDTPGQRLLRPPHPCLPAPLAGVLLGVQRAHSEPPGVQAELDVFNCAVPADASLPHQDPTPRPGSVFLSCSVPHPLSLNLKKKIK